MAPLTLPAPDRRVFERLSQDLQRVFGHRFVALVATSPSASLAFVDGISSGDLDALGPLVQTWHRDRLAVPLVITPDEFRRSLDVFPIEYQTILDHHEVIVGTPPFAGARVSPAALQHACEVRARGHLVHLRQGWIEAAGHEHQLAALIAHSAAPLRGLLASVARLGDGTGTTAADGARRAGLDERLVADVLATEHAPDRAEHLVPRLAEYLTAAERLWTFVDQWR